MQENYFGKPIDLPMNLAGTFGELRYNHFHTGIDIKTNGKEGYKLYSVADGYVSRIKVSSTGYGNALYIDHPNGYTSVYAHMQVFADSIQKYITTKQYAEQKWEQDFLLDPFQFQVKKGETIGLSGNSGSSSGPHLHFELRETQSEHPVNPLAFGYTCEDETPPYILALKTYDATDKHFEPFQKIYPIKVGSNYKVKGDTVFVPGGPTGFAIQTFDKHLGHNNGVYQITVYRNDELAFQVEFDELDFSTGRYINAYIDYEEKKKNNATFNQLFKLHNNKLDVYKITNVAQKYGAIHSYETPRVKIEVCDFNGNSTTLSFVLASNVNLKKAQKTHNCLDNEPNSSYLVLENEIKVQMPYNNTYRDLCFMYDVRAPKSKGVHSQVHKVHNAFQPAHNYFTVSIEPDSAALKYPEKTVVCYLDYNNDEQSCNTHFDGQYFVGETREFGEYYLRIDSVGPKLNIQNFKKGSTISKNTTLKFTVKDALTSLAKYNAFVNDKWTILEYNKRRNTLYLKDKRYFVKGKNEIKIIVEDAKQNLTQQSFSLNYK